MLPLNSSSVLDLSLLGVDHVTAAPPSAEDEVLRLFDTSAAALLRYVTSFGLSQEIAEDVVQDVFLALFRHVKLARSRRNLQGWIFRVAHNLALKQRTQMQRRGAAPLDDTAYRLADPAPSAEDQLADRERHQRLQPVLVALPARDRACLSLRADGLRYRDIASALGMSLGGVAKSLARSMTRLVNADRG